MTLTFNRLTNARLILNIVMKLNLTQLSPLDFTGSSVLRNNIRQVHYIYNRIPTSRLLRTVKPRSPYFSQVNPSMGSEPHGDKFSTAEWPDLPEEAHANIADCNRKAGFESEPRQVEQTRHEQFEHTQVLINDIKLDGAESYFSEVSDPFVKPFPDRPEGTSVRWVYVLS